MDGFDIVFSVVCLSVQPAFSKPSASGRGAVFNVVIAPADWLATSKGVKSRKAAPCGHASLRDFASRGKHRKPRRSLGKYKSLSQEPGGRTRAGPCGGRISATPKLTSAKAARCANNFQPQRTQGTQSRAVFLCGYSRYAKARRYTNSFVRNRHRASKSMITMKSAAYRLRKATSLRFNRLP